MTKNMVKSRMAGCRRVLDCKRVLRGRTYEIVAPSVVDVLGQETSGNRCDVGGIGQEDGEDSHCAASLVKEEGVRHHAGANREERRSTNSIENLMVCECAFPMIVCTELTRVPMS